MAVSESASDSESSQAGPRLWLGILGVTIALSAPVVQILLRPLWELFEFPVDRLLTLVPFWAAVVLALGIAHYGEGYPLARFGFQRDQEKTLRTRLIEWILAVVASVVVGAVVIFMSQNVREMLTGEPATQLEIVNMLPYWVLIPAWITAWFAEEVLFRSYAIERLTDMTGRLWLAGLIAMLAFALMHWLTWDWIHVVTVVLPASILQTLLYMWRRNLVIVMIVHAILNAPLLLLPIVASTM